MSDYYQTFVSVDMDWQPTKDSAAEAVRWLWSMASQTESIKAEFLDRIDYVDPVCNWDGARCPACGKRVSDDWFGDTMIDWYKSEARPMNIVMPCCDTASTLDALDFISPAAFTRFRLEMMNSWVVISEAQIQQLEKILGTELRKIWTHI